jgi:hypothetical protein
VIFQFFLLAAMALLMVFGWRQKQRAPAVGWAIMVTASLGMALAIAPSILQPIADAVGVGRGVDLMIYLFMVATILLVANVHLRMREMRDAMTDIIRRSAIDAVQNAHATPHEQLTNKN